MRYHYKGESRLFKNRKTRGKVHPHDQQLNCRFPKGGKAFRNKGRAHFKTGRKRQKQGKSSR